MIRSLFFVLVAFVGSGFAQAQLGPVAEVSGGPIVGLELDGVYNFRGIPYAAPPVGDLRWAPPQPVAEWPRLRDCRSFAPICPQPEYPRQSLYARATRPMSEDCLYLNVWTRAMDADAKLPVMVWIHGGGFTRGTGATDAYDGSALTEKGVVVVTINYRLGTFGFLAHPDLSAESAHDSSGNYAILDMVASLEWVHDNIATFGGDPGNVTIFGESAGSWAVNSLIGTPLAKGLFHRAIGQSGGSFGPMADLKNDSDAGPSAEALGLAFQKMAGAESLAELRAMSADKLLATQVAFAQHHRQRATVDGRVFPTSIMQAYRNGTHNDVPVIVGFNRDEQTAFMDPRQFPTTIEGLDAMGMEKYGDDWPAVKDLYPVRETPDIKDAIIHMATESGFGLSMYTWAEMTQRGESEAYLYYFTRAPGIPNTDYYGSYHAAEIMYTFNNLHVRPGPYDADDHALAETLSDYWTNFARTGNPNGEGLAEWPAYEEDAGPYMELGDSVQAGDHLLQERMEFWAERADW